jgi:hypothetical protein
LDSIARVSGSATPLNTERKQNQVTSSAILPLPLIRPRTEDESSSTAKGSPISIAENRTLTFDTISQLPHSSRRTVIHALLPSWKLWSSRWVTGFLPTISLAEWLHVSLVALRRTKQWAFLGQALLRRWKCEFKRDWIAMINAMHSQR